MIKNIAYIIILSILSSSCFKKDEVTDPHLPGDITTVVVPMTMYYTNQVYVDLEDTDFTSTNNRSDFDLNFSCDDTSSVIRLNTANFGLAAITEFEDFESVTDTSGLNWKFDGSTGDLDSLAFDNWITITNGDTSFSKKVWVMNRGISSLGIQLGLKKLKFTGLVGDKFYFTHCKMDNSDLTNAVVEKNPEHINTQYSFEEMLQKQIEPNYNDWDLIFTQYTTMLYTTDGQAYPYLVTGVMQKYDMLSVALDTTLAFSDINLSDTLLMDFSLNFDKIGYDWKELIGDVNTGNISYETKLNYNYIIRDEQLAYYKLRFISFYNPETGEKGYPTFEYQRL